MVQERSLWISVIFLLIFLSRMTCYASDCDKLPDIGSCTLAKIRYFYYSADNRCHRFGYGGCDGNGNNFMSERDCMRTCAGQAPTRSSLEMAQRRVFLNTYPRNDWLVNKSVISVVDFQKNFFLSCKWTLLKTNAEAPLADYTMKGLKAISASYVFALNIYTDIHGAKIQY